MKQWDIWIFLRRVLIGACTGALSAFHVDPISWSALGSAALAGALAGAGVDTDAFRRSR
jgi:hypothetical protein